MVGLNFKKEPWRRPGHFSHLDDEARAVAPAAAWIRSCLLWQLERKKKKKRSSSSSSWAKRPSLAWHILWILFARCYYRTITSLLHYCRYCVGWFLFSNDSIVIYTARICCVDFSDITRQSVSIWEMFLPSFLTVSIVTLRGFDNSRWLCSFSYLPFTCQTDYVAGCRTAPVIPEGDKHQPSSKERKEIFLVEEKKIWNLRGKVGTWSWYWHAVELVTVSLAFIFSWFIPPLSIYLFAFLSLSFRAVSVCVQLDCSAIQCGSRRIIWKQIQPSKNIPETTSPRSTRREKLPRSDFIPQNSAALAVR